MILNKKVYTDGDVKFRKKFAFLPKQVRTTNGIKWIWLETYIERQVFINRKGIDHCGFLTIDYIINNPRWSPKSSCSPSSPRLSQSAFIQPVHLTAMKSMMHKLRKENEHSLDPKRTGLWYSGGYGSMEVESSRTSGRNQYTPACHVWDRFIRCCLSWYLPATSGYGRL